MATTSFAPSWGGSVPTGADGRPLGMNFNTIGDANTGLLQAPYNSTNQLDTTGYNALKAEATRAPGTMSTWGNMALTGARNQAAQQAAGQYQQGVNSLASAGGLRSGSRERMAGMGLSNQLMAGQNAYNNIQTQDEQNRLNSINNLTGAAMQKANYDTGIENTNIGRALNEVTQGRQFQSNQYNEAMKAWAAMKTAEAAGNSGGGGGIFSGSGLPNSGDLLGTVTGTKFLGGGK